MRRLLVLSSSAAIALAVAPARAVDLPRALGDPIRLDVTETSVVAQRYDAREGESPPDHGYGAWLNRLNAALRWREWTLGVRLDSSLYWRRPDGRGDIDPAQHDNVALDGLSRFRDAVYPAKLWATYQTRELEVTVGDAYVQFGRGLVLSMRKIDELGIDNTVRGGKLTWQKDPFAVTLVAGLANPSRVDEATGRALFLPARGAVDPNPSPVFGSDRIVGAELQAGRGLPVVLTTHVVRLTRCAPYRYDAAGHVVDGAFDAPVGSCAPGDTAAWLATLPNSNPILNASEVTVAGQGVEIPSLGGHGTIYLEAAAQHRHVDTDPLEPHANGNALYGSFSADAGPVTNTVEVKSYRNFYALAGAVDVSRAAAFNNIAYSTPPTAEAITQDSELGFFNACVDGGRLRTDVRVSPTLLVYGTAAYFHTKSEITGGGCDAHGNTVTSSKDADAVHDDVWDGTSGIEWRFDRDRSYLYASSGARDDRKATGEPFYRELHTEYALSKHIAGPYSIELSGRHRLRREENLNARNGLGSEEPWREGEHYTALKIAPRWVLTQGIEYTTLAGLPTLYVNGALLYRFSGGSNVKVLAGQQRGGLKCVSGVCKVFPPFEGVRAEVTLRF